LLATYMHAGVLQAVDFDRDSLRATLPKTVGHIARSLLNGKTTFVHCTAGLGRAPASCIAYLYWFHDYNLYEAYDCVTSIRPCGPNRDAIRGATFDICTQRPAHEFAGLPPDAFHDMSVQERQTLRERVLVWH
jgi:Dual specificity phosphatase, catalytic domain